MSSRLTANSPLDRNWLRNNFAELAIFCLAASLLFIKLGIGEFENWDESHIVYRALVIEQHGAWLDQSAFSLGGLYSSAHPPLGIWLMVVSRTLFGHGEFATRLPAAVCGLIAAVSMFYLLRRWCSDRLSLLLAAAFIACSIMLWFSRHAQLDSLLIAASLTSLTLFQNAVDKGSRVFATAGGVVFGLAMLSKFGWACYSLPFIIGYWYLHGKDRALIARFMLPAVIIGSSWYLYMIATNDAFSSSVFGWLVGLSSVEGYETSSRSPVYYFNQLILACPFILAALVIFLRRQDRTREEWLTLAWLSIVMVVLQVTVTKFPHFALMLLPPAFLFVAQSMKRMALGWLEWGVMIMAVAWSLSTQFRLWIRGAEFVYVSPEWGIAFTLSLALTLLLALIRGDTQRTLITGLAGLIVIVAANRVISTPGGLYDSGAKQIANRILPRTDIIDLVVVHSGLPHDSLTPRLAYYTNGWRSGWLEGRAVRKMEWTDSSITAKLSNVTTHSAVVLERELDRFALPAEEAIPQYNEVKTVLKRDFGHYDSLRSYDLFYN